MKLYHGTSSRYLKSILENGLLPRNESGVSNWKGHVVSKEGFIYLSDAYPVYFACQATKADDDLLIIEVEVEKQDLYPDEDFVARWMKYNFPRFAKMPLAEINSYVDMEAKQNLAEISLQLNGNVAIKSVPSHRICRHVIIPFSSKESRRRTIMSVLSIGGDSCPITMNYKILGPMYRNCIQVLFDEGLEVATQVAIDYWAFRHVAIAQLDEVKS